MANIDLEMGQFQKVTTLENKDYIVVSLDNGTQGQIKVSDLASVVAAGVFAAKVNTIFIDISGIILDEYDEGYYYKIISSGLSSNAIIINIAVGTWSGNVFFSCYSNTNVIIRSATQYTMPKGRGIFITYIV